MGSNASVNSYHAEQGNETRPARILIVEDDVGLSFPLMAALSRSHSVMLAADAPTALAAIEANRFDVILLDLILPRGTGLEVLAALTDGRADPPRVIITSALARQVDLSSFEQVVAGTLAKPFGMPEVLRAVQNALSGERKPEPSASSAAMATILLVDDDQEFLQGMATHLRRAGYRVTALSSPKEALEAVKSQRFDAVITDWIMPETSGMDLLQQIRTVAATMPVLLLTGYATPDLTRRALEAGVSDVLMKPFPPGALPVALEKCLLQASAVAEERTGERVAQPSQKRTPIGPLRYAPSDIIGDSTAMRRARQALLRVATVDASVLIHGETGTGKELFAQALHQLSARRDGPFVALNAAAIPESLLESELFGYTSGAFTGARKEGQKGKFLQADGGTLFLDEIGDLPLGLQVKLLRVLQEGQVDLVGGGSKRVDVRIVAATHRNLQEMVDAGSFRSDLYYRLNVVSLTLPRLQERLDDLPLLAERFLDELRRRYHRPGVRFSTEVLDLMARYPWPGNVRELRNVVERAFAFASGDLILPVDLPLELHEQEAAGGASLSPSPPQAPPRTLAVQEKEAITRALEATGGNKLKASKLLGISRAGLYVKLKVYGIE